MYCLATCNLGQSASDLPVEYTDVVYSADGTQITLYLDGLGVPVTQSQRALTKEMAQMACDFYEAVFWAYEGTEPKVSRTTWEIGQSAGIKGVYKGTDPANGYQYVPSGYMTPPFSGIGITCIFVGRKVDKTLLALGRMTLIDGKPDFEVGYRITSSTKSVTFTIGTFTTRLNLEYDYHDDNATSFYTASGNPLSSYPNLTNTKANNMAEYVSLGGVDYPYYKLPNSPSVAALYYIYISIFSGTNLPYNIRIINDSLARPEIIKREPRFLSGGQYHYVQAAKIDTGTEVIFDPAYASYFADDGINGCDGYYIFFPAAGIRFIFDTSNSQGGIFSFTFRIPVYNLTRLPSEDGVTFTTWYLQPGFGRDLFSLDNGVDAGGCILMGYNAESPSDMIEIYTE